MSREAPCPEKCWLEAESQFRLLMRGRVSDELTVFLELVLQLLAYLVS